MKLGPDFQVFKLDVCELGLKVLVWLYRTEQYVYWLDQIQIIIKHYIVYRHVYVKVKSVEIQTQKKNKKERKKQKRYVNKSMIIVAPMRSGLSEKSWW